MVLELGIGKNRSGHVSVPRRRRDARAGKCLSCRSELGNLLHDLGQPLAAIQALAATVADPAAVADSDALRDRLRRIDEIGNWMNDLLRSGAAAGPAGPRAATVDVSELVQDTVLTAAASFRGTLRWRPCGPARVLADPVELRRAVANVVDNAVRAAGPHGSVAARVLRLPGAVQVEVEDDGPGFGRIPTRTRRGLSGTRDLLDRCGGRMEIGSGDSVGTVVRIELPLAAGR